MTVITEKPCDACGGTGEGSRPPYWHHSFPPACESCRGHGYVEVDEDETTTEEEE